MRPATARVENRALPHANIGGRFVEQPDFQMVMINRRTFFRRSAVAGLACAASPVGSRLVAARTGGLRFGLVTYLWGRDMDLPTLLAACETSGLLGLEVRTEHAHKVEPMLDKPARAEVKKRFADSPVTLVGYGSNARFHENDPARLAENIALAKDYVRLMHDCGGSGVKVKPDGFVEGVPRERTVEQIGRALNEVARFGADHGQEIRVEVHGRGTSDPAVIKAIFDIADHPNAKICWNSNATDLAGAGIEANFNLLRSRFGATAHVRELDSEGYPWPDLVRLFKGINYPGWILLEAHTPPPADGPAAWRRQRELFERLAV